jgi:hypothetical protein
MGFFDKIQSHLILSYRMVSNLFHTDKKPIHVPSVSLIRRPLCYWIKKPIQVPAGSVCHRSVRSLTCTIDVKQTNILRTVTPIVNKFRPIMTNDFYRETSRSYYIPLQITESRVQSPKLLLTDKYIKKK